MTIKHLQLNTSVLRAPSEVAKFVLTQKIDLACFQEIFYPTTGSDPLKELLEKEGFSYASGTHFVLTDKNQISGVAIASRWPILDFHCVWYNGTDFGPKQISDKELLGKVLEDASSDHFPGSRGLKHSVKSRCFLLATIQTEAGPLSVICSSFTVSDLCTETTQMYDMANMVTSLIKGSKDLPTLFSGDLNIRAQSYSVTKIKEVLTCHTQNLTDTLSDAHIAKKHDFPNGLAVDHVFSKHLTHKSTEAIQIDFSDHKALVSLFDF